MDPVHNSSRSRRVLRWLQVFSVGDECHLALGVDGGPGVLVSWCPVAHPLCTEVHPSRPEVPADLDWYLSLQRSLYSSPSPSVVLGPQQSVPGTPDLSFLSDVAESRPGTPVAVSPPYAVREPLGASSPRPPHSRGPDVGRRPTGLRSLRRGRGRYTGSRGTDHPSSL